MLNALPKPRADLIEQPGNRSVGSLDTPIGILARGVLHDLKNPCTEDRRLFQIDQLHPDHYPHATGLLEKLLL
jgi:hypothetical protein